MHGQNKKPLLLLPVEPSLGAGRRKHEQGFNVGFDANGTNPNGCPQACQDLPSQSGIGYNPPRPSLLLDVAFS